MNRTFKRTVSMFLCVLMLLGSMTFVAAEEKSVDAKMFWSDNFGSGYSEIDNSEPIFDVKGFEPGESILKYLKLENAGNRAFLYDLSFKSEGTIGELADVIDVYVKVVSEDYIIAEEDKIGTLAEVINGDAINSGKILPNDYVGVDYFTKHTVVAVGLKMQETASDDYQGESVGAFDIVLTATEDTEFGDYPNKFAVKFENTNKYLYRVGNQNAVALGSLFEELDGVTVGNVNIKVDKLDDATDVAYTYTANDSDWTKGTIKFTGTGPVKATITDDGKNNTTPVSLNLEVVSAYNVTTYSELSNRNSVLLADITMSANGAFYLSNATLYGNGFEFDVTKGAVAGSGYVTANSLVGLSSATLDNIKITGAVYTGYGATASSNYSRAAVLSSGNSRITNSYISNCASPVRVNSGQLEIVNSTLKGGNLANLDIRNGNVILDNVTTINQVEGNDLAADDSVVGGLGIAMYYEQVLDTTTLEIRNGITQYNYVSQSQADECIKDSTVKQLVNIMFGSGLGSIQYNDGTDIWVNTGIVFLSEDVPPKNLICNDDSLNGYTESYPFFMGKEGYAKTLKPNADTIKSVPPEYKATAQAAIAPSYSFDYTTKNYIAKSEGSNDYCYEDAGVVHIAFDEGDTFSWDTEILTAEKYRNVLDYTVSMDGVDYTDKSIVFSQSGNHTVEYTYVDPYNYSIGSDGSFTQYSVTYTKSVDIAVSAIKPEARNASFAFGSSEIASRKITIGNDTYVMPDVTANSNTVGSTTVNGNTIYYPIVDAYTSDGKYEHSSLQSWEMCFPVFKGVVSITDYKDSGTGVAEIYNASTTTLPKGLSVDNPSETFKYQSGSPAPTTPANKSGVLCFLSPTLSNNARAEQNYVVKYTYVDNAGATYYYYVGYHCPETKVAASSIPCVTADTLVTLVDGSQKRIDELEYTDELLVWDFYEGKYTTAMPAKIDNHGIGNNTKITLNFEDGTVINVTNNHYFYDADLNEFVSITEETAQSYIGHSFVQQDGDGYKTVKLVSSNVTKENIESWSVLTAVHYNCIMEDMFSLTASQVEGNLFMPFEVGENMTFDAEKLQADVEEYGLYTYDEFSGYITEDVFNALNMPYIKVAVGKGIVSYDDVIFLLEYHFEPPEVILEDNDIAQLSNVEEEKPLTDTVISSNNNITAAVYSVEITCNGATEKEGVYTCTSNTAVFTITPNGTTTKGYVTITVDGDKYTIPVNSVYTLTVKNAYGKEVSFATGWGAAESDVENNLIDLGELTIKAVEKTETGVTVTLSNTTKGDITGDLYIAVYNESKLVTVKREENTVIESKDTEKEVSFEVEVGENCTIKAFIWSPSGVTPLAASK